MNVYHINELLLKLVNVQHYLINNVYATDDELKETWDSFVNTWEDAKKSIDGHIKELIVKDVKKVTSLVSDRIKLKRCIVCDKKVKSPTLIDNDGWVVCSKAHLKQSNRSIN